MSLSLHIRIVPGRYAVSRLDADAVLPDWLQGLGFKAVVYSEDETTVVCLEERVPCQITSERGWACLRTIGPFPFDAAGIVASLIAPLSNEGIGVFVVCTFDGEHVLVPYKKLDAAIEYLKAAGHAVCDNHKPLSKQEDG